MTRVYCVIIPNSVRKMLEALDEPLRARIIRRLDALASNPRPRGAVKLTNQHNTFRLRAAEWRIVHEVRDAELVVLLVKIGHRREVYREADAVERAERLASPGGRLARSHTSR